jgi:hypothetical protein
MNDFCQEKRCTQCKKKFIVLDNAHWVYKRTKGTGVKYFCSWSCIRKYDGNHETAIDRREKVIQAIMDGLTNREISALLDVKCERVEYWRKRVRNDSV